VKKRYLILAALVIALASCGQETTVIDKVLQPDADYGAHGVAVAADAGATNSGDVALSITQKDGVVLLGGHGCANADAVCANLASQDAWVAAAWSFDSAGEPNAAFNGDGVFSDNNAAGGGRTNVVFAVANSSGGYRLAGGGRNSSGDEDAVVWALTDNGAPDSSLYSGGKAVLPEVAGTGTLDDVFAMQPATGYTWLAGTIKTSDFKMAVWRVKDDGSLDSGFDGDGVFVSSPSGGIEWANGMTLASDGSLLLAGTHYEGSAKARVWKVKAAGGLDQGYGVSGVVDLPLPSGASGRALAIVNDAGEAVAAGTVSAGGAAHLAIWRLKDNGSPDVNFGNGGMLILDGESPANYYRAKVAVAVDDQGYYWLVGGLKNDSGNLDMAVWRVTPEGKLDAHFCNGGPCVFDNAAGGHGDDWGTDLALADDAIYVGGWSWNGHDFDAVVWKLGLVEQQ